MHRHILVAMPHPDDETLAVGGTIALNTRAGTPVTYLCATHGEMGRNMGRPPFATRESLRTLREVELRAACDALGIKDLRFMGIWDKTVEFVDPAWLAHEIGKVIAELQPSLVITYHPVHGVHPDHNAMGAAIVKAMAAIPDHARPPLWTRAFGPKSSELGEPDEVVDVSGVMEMKLAAMVAHRSQTEFMFAKAAEDPEVRKQMLEQRAKESFFVWRF